MSNNDSMEWLASLQAMQNECDQIIALVPNHDGKRELWDVYDMDYDGEDEEGDAYTGGVLGRGETPCEAVMKAKAALDTG